MGQFLRALAEDLRTALLPRDWRDPAASQILLAQNAGAARRGASAILAKLTQLMQVREVAATLKAPPDSSGADRRDFVQKTSAESA